MTQAEKIAEAEEILNEEHHCGSSRACYYGCINEKWSAR